MLALILPYIMCCSVVSWIQLTLTDTTADSGQIQLPQAALYDATSKCPPSNSDME